MYAQLTPETNAAVRFVFAHRKQLDFGSLLGPNGCTELSDIASSIQVLHAHIRRETITDFSVQPSFSPFKALRKYMESLWIPLAQQFWVKEMQWLAKQLKISKQHLLSRWWCHTPARAKIIGHMATVR